MQSVFNDTVTLRRFRYLKRHDHSTLVECGMLGFSQSSIHGAQVAWQFNESSPMTPPHGTWKQLFVEPEVHGPSDERIQYLWVQFNSRWPERVWLKATSFVSTDFGVTWKGIDQHGDERQAILLADEEWQTDDKPSPSALPASEPPPSSSDGFDR